MRTTGLLPRAQAAIGIGYIALLAAFAVWARFEPPYRDDWDWLLSILTGPGGIAGLWQPHNEHVIPLARALMTMQFVWEGLTGSLVQYVALLCHLIMVWCFWREVARRWPGDASWRWTVGGLVLVCLGFTQQLQSLVFAAAVLFPLVQLWTTLAIVAVLVATEPHTTRVHSIVWWGLTILCAIAAAASTTSGLVVPVIIGALAWLRGASWKVAAAWTAATVALLAAYVLWVGLGQEAAGSGVVEPWAPPSVRGLVAYALAVLSAGVPYVHRGAAVLLGAGVLAGMAGAAWLAVRRRDRLARLEVFALGQMAFGLASTLMVAPGRAQYGVLQAAQSRYATFVVCVLAGLVMFWASRLSAATPRPATTRVAPRLAAAGLLLSLVLLGPNVYIGLLWRAKAENLNVAFLSLRSGVAEPAWIVTLHPLIPVIDQVVAAAGRRGIPIVDPAIGTVLAEVPAATCAGAGALTRGSRDRGMNLTGQWPLSLTRGAIIDQAGVIVGLAQPLPWVEQPEPTADEVHAGVLRGIRNWTRQGARDSAWGGFAAAGAGAPYRLVAGDDTGWSCAAALTVTASVHVGLDAMTYTSGQWQATGWAFACGEPIVGWQLLVDDLPVEAPTVTAVPRPDVDSVFTSRCTPDGMAGVILQMPRLTVPHGPHTAVLRVVTRSGVAAQSPAIAFVAPAGVMR